MTEIAFDFASAANGTRSIPAQISSPQVNATFTSTLSLLLGIPSSINFYHQFGVNRTGSNCGDQQGYVYVQLTSTVPIQLTRVRFWMQSPALDPGLALAIEASEKIVGDPLKLAGPVVAVAYFSAPATLATKLLVVPGAGGVDVDLPTHIRLRQGTNYLRIWQTTPTGTNQHWMAYANVKIDVEADNEGDYPSVELVAKALAPKIRFHPKERHFPCSVEWFFSRCRLLSGGGDIKPDTNFVGLDIATHFKIPDGMSVLSEGPLDPYNLPAATLAPSGSRTD